MTTQLSRQLELNIAALSRGFRQALRYAQKHDPQGTEETSPAWKTVAARQALLLNMLSAVGSFLQPKTPAPAVSQPAESPATLVDDVNNSEDKAQAPDNDDDDNDYHPVEPDLTEEEILAMLPPDIQRVREKIVAVIQWPTNNHRQKRHRSLELQRLQGTLERRLKEWKADALVQAGLPATE